MLNRIQKKFNELKKNKQKALILYLMAGDLPFKKNEQLILDFEKEGADLIELGVPFSDPLADGPVIQAAGQRSLANGTNLKKILQLVKNVRKKSGIPLVLMTYLNPVWHYGVARFARDARKAGVDGLIVPDLPTEEGGVIASVMKRYGLDLVYLLAPTSSAARQRSVAKKSKGFVYYVSLTGVTGVRTNLARGLSAQIRAAKRASSLPVCVGFGVSKPAQAREVARTADGVIIGTAVVRALHENRTLSPAKLARKIVRPFALALGKRR